MDNEELKKKIIDVLRDNREYELRYYPDDNYTEVVIDYEAIADALIEAGLKFDVDYSFTATFDHMQQARIDCLAHRAEVAERALRNIMVACTSRRRARAGYVKTEVDENKNAFFVPTKKAKFDKERKRR